MQAYRVHTGRGSAGLERFDLPPRPTGGREVRVRLRAVSLNYRDLLVARGQYLTRPSQPVIPCSDGAGEVVEVGAEVTRFAPGDAVVTSFFPRWVDGPPTAEKTAGALGGEVDGVLAEERVLPEEALAPMPPHLDFAAAATLPCAGVTAWNAVFHTAGLRPGATVLLLGTGGVSILGLQIARGAGLRTVITSSSDEKLARARELGAHETINYRTTPEWQQEVLRRTNGRGVDVVLEVGGKDTLARSVESTAVGGTIAIIGGVAGGFGGEIAPSALLTKARRVMGVFVGSRAMLEELGAFVTAAEVTPFVDRVFPFDRAREAYDYLAEARHVGKVVVGIGD